jgi:hypothetical protein
LRVPIEISATQTPKKMSLRAASDEDADFEVALSATTKDAVAAFYTDVGLPSSEVHGGDELVLSAGFGVTFTLRVMGININKTLPNDRTFDFSQDFVPPFGNCGTNCGFEVWIPADVTRTSVNILGIIKGSARAGVNVSGDGDVFVDFEALVDGASVQSWAKGAKKDAKKKHEIQFGSASESRTRVATAPAIKKADVERTFGYRLSDPKYDWTIVLTPGVRGDIDVNAKPIFSDHFTIGPFWLHALAMELGTVHLRGHDGTDTTAEYEHGTKTWKDRGTEGTPLTDGKAAAIHDGPGD